MSTRKSIGKSAPKYALHKATGQARVRINGKSYYLGKHGSDESQEKYQRLLAEQWSPTGKPKPRVQEPTDEITISYLAVEYAKHAQAYYQKNGKPTDEWTMAKTLLKRLRAVLVQRP